VRLPRRTPLVSSLKCSCAILPSGLVFENVRQRVGCVARLTLKGVLGIAVEFERSLLTAKNLRSHILCINIHKIKPNLASSGGNS
jgi:hypothetical protein